MKIVIKAFLRHLLRRRSLSILQLFGIACGVAAVVGKGVSEKKHVSVEGYVELTGYSGSMGDVF